MRNQKSKMFDRLALSRSFPKSAFLATTRAKLLEAALGKLRRRSIFFVRACKVSRLQVMTEPLQLLYLYSQHISSQFTAG